MTFTNVFLCCLAAIILAFLVLVIVLKERSVTGWPITSIRDSWPLLLILIVVTVSVLALYGCGTAPLQVKTNPPVPAGLLTPPRPPVLLTPASPSTTPGATTPSTPSSAPKTGSTTSV